MISTIYQRYILLALTSLCLCGLVYIGYSIYTNFYIPIFDEVSSINNQPVEHFPSPTVAAVLQAFDERQQQTVDLTTVHNPFGIPSGVTNNNTIPSNELEPTPQ